MSIEIDWSHEDIPDWVNWIAWDSDGTEDAGRCPAYGYEEKPEPTGDPGIWQAPFLHAGKRTKYCTLPFLDHRGDRPEEVIQRPTTPEPKPEIPKTLRDEFAMAALTGLLANPSTGVAWHLYPEWAYEIADEMLKAREASK